MLSRYSILDTLDSFYFENQTLGALHKAWNGFVIAKNKYEVDYYAQKVGPRVLLFQVFFTLQTHFFSF